MFGIYLFFTLGYLVQSGRGRGGDRNISYSLVFWTAVLRASFFSLCILTPNIHCRVVVVNTSPPCICVVCVCFYFGTAASSYYDVFESFIYSGVSFRKSSVYLWLINTRTRFFFVMVWVDGTSAPWYGFANNALSVCHLWMRQLWPTTNHRGCILLETPPLIFWCCVLRGRWRQPKMWM